MNDNVEGYTTGAEMLSISESESSTTLTTGNSTDNTPDEGTIITESENVDFGGLFSESELEQLQTLNISASIGSGR